MSNKNIHEIHKLKMPNKHYLDFLILTIVGAAPWIIWGFTDSSWAFGFGIGLTPVALTFMIVQAVGGIMIRKSTTLHFQVTENTGVAKVWMHKPPSLWRNIMSASNNLVNLKLADVATYKKINGKPVLALVESETNNILNIPYRLAHQPAVNTYLKEALKPSTVMPKEYVDKALSFLNEKNEKNIVAESRY